MRLGYWLAHPRMLAHRIGYWAWEKSNPDKPWLCPGTIRFCEQHFKGSRQALEYGSGRSTRWFASLTSHLTSVEASPEWYEEVKTQLRGDGITNVDYLHVPLDHPWADPEREVYDPMPSYVAVADRFADGTLDFVSIDGHYRTHCVRRAAPKVAPGGYLLLDDANRWNPLASVPVPAGWRIVDNSTNGVKRCVIWQAPARS